jgi:hypothetical protein
MGRYLRGYGLLATTADGAFSHGRRTLTKTRRVTWKKTLTSLHPSGCLCRFLVMSVITLDLCSQPPRPEPVALETDNWSGSAQEIAWGSKSGAILLMKGGVVRVLAIYPYFRRFVASSVVYSCARPGKQATSSGTTQRKIYYS